MKKLIASSLALMLAVSLAGCDDKQSNTEEQIQGGEKTGLEILKDQNKNVAKFKGVPDWAKKLGALEPVGLTLDDKLSDNTAEDVEKHMNKGFSAHYYGEPKVLMAEAEKLVKALNGNINTKEDDFLLADGKINGGEFSLSIIVRTDSGKPFMLYSLQGTKKF